MSISSSNTKAKRCRHCNAEMVKIISKSKRNLGRPYWKCFTTYRSIIFPNLGATRCSGYEWVTAANTPTESDIQNQVYVKELNAYAEVIHILKGINTILLLLEKGELDHKEDFVP
ncbi:unnamed protein product [Prunus armeniaca]